MKASSRIIFAGIVVAMVMGARHCATQEQDAHLRPAITELLTHEVADNANACLKVGPFPFEAQGRGHWVPQHGHMLRCYAEYRPSCDQCEDLYRVGLLSRTVVDSQSPGVQGGIRYALTEQGRALYYDNTRDRDAHGSNLCTIGEERSGDDLPEIHYQPGFCFAKSVRLHHIDETEAPAKFGGRTLVGVKYTLEAVDPDPLLFDPRIGTLLHGAPQSGTPALYAPAIVTIGFYPDGSKQLEDVRYGKWANSP